MIALAIEDNVSIHAPARGATKGGCRRPHPVQFQSTRPRGARLRGKQGQHHHCSFNPRARAGRDTIRGVERENDEMFQSTRPRGARPAGSTPEGPRTGFNPRARAGRDRRRDLRQTRLRVVSIHAPARGATRSASMAKVNRLRVSIHAPARGATAPVIRVGRLAPNVSIHAPARGATYGQAQFGTLLCFNPRARAGRDPTGHRAGFACPGFNPRARAGRDPLSPAPRWTALLFQSTRPRGARPMEQLDSRSAA